MTGARGGRLRIGRTRGRSVDVRPCGTCAAILLIAREGLLVTIATAMNGTTAPGTVTVTGATAPTAVTAATVTNGTSDAGARGTGTNVLVRARALDRDDTRRAAMSGNATATFQRHLLRQRSVHLNRPSHDRVAAPPAANSTVSTLHMTTRTNKPSMPPQETGFVNVAHIILKGAKYATDATAMESDQKGQFMGLMPRGMA